MASLPKPPIAIPTFAQCYYWLRIYTIASRATFHFNNYFLFYFCTLSSGVVAKEAFVIPVFWIQVVTLSLSPLNIVVFFASNALVIDCGLLHLFLILSANNQQIFLS
jgi:hypothetical protein